MKTLRSVFYYAQPAVVHLYFDNDGFRDMAVKPVGELPAEEQAKIAAALGWLSAQLPADFTTTTRVILEPDSLLTNPEAPEEPGQRTLKAGVTGEGEKGEKTIAIPGGDATEEVRAGLLAVWDALEAGLNAG